MISFFLLACEKPDPNPELRDPIYADLNSTLGAVSQEIEGEKKNLSDNEKALQEVIPQTGQIKYAQKRVQESKEKITRLEQEKAYLELKIENRRKSTKKSYAKAFANQEAWPDPQEWASYQAEKRLRSAKRTWDIKNRMHEAQIGGPEATNHAAPAGGGH
ncbi:MAG: hypothetical protein AAGB31_03280 [Bdellovibrio sp.]